MKIDEVRSALDLAIDVFCEDLDADFKRGNIVFQLFDESNKLEVFEAFCKKHFPYRLSDPYQEDGYFDFLASAFVGKDNGGIDGILIRTDVQYNPGELWHTLLHELAHIYCVHNELDGKDFYDLYCNGTAPTAAEDSIINAGYAIWRECIAEIIAIELDDACYITSLSSKKKQLSFLNEKLNRSDGKLAMSMILTSVMTSKEIEGTKEWASAQKCIAQLNLFDELMFHDMFKVVFFQLRSAFCEIKLEFIHEIGSIYLELLTIRELKSWKPFECNQ